LAHAEGGLVIYMLCDGRGAGLLTKVRGLALGDAEGLNTHDAYVALGVETDPREYERVTVVLSALGVRSIRLLTNNPRKVSGLRSRGLPVERIPLEFEPTEDSRRYLETKKNLMGHLLELDGHDH
jgi:GTP cyclohydrolase II